MGNISGITVTYCHVKADLGVQDLSLKAGNASANWTLGYLRFSTHTCVTSLCAMVTIGFTRPHINPRQQQAHSSANSCIHAAASISHPAADTSLLLALAPHLPEPRLRTTLNAAHRTTRTRTLAPFVLGKQQGFGICRGSTFYPC